MAVVGFQLAGSIIGAKIAAAYSFGTVGTAVATAIGSIIGAGIGNELFPTRIETERFRDLNVTNSAYGLPIPIIYGAQNRVAGNVIWSSGLNETKRVKKVGTFPARTSVTSYTYDVSFAIALGAGTCRNINRIWLNKKLAFDRSAYSGSTPDSTPWTVTTGISIEELDFASLSFYPGDFTQTPDPTMVAALGAGNVPAYRGTCYLVFANLQLKDYGNQLPQVEVEVEGIANDSVGAIVVDIMDRAGLAVDERAVSNDLNGITVRGYQITSAGNAINAINPLLAAYGLITAEHGGTVRVMSRNKGAICTIPIEHMGARSAGESPSATYPLAVFRGPDYDLPREASVTFLDVNRDYQSGTQRAQRDLGNPLTNLTIELPLVLTADEARVMADRALYEPYLQRVTFQFSVGELYASLSVGNLVSFPVAGRYVSARINRINRGANGAYEVEAYQDDGYVFEGSGVGSEGAIPANPFRYADATTGYLFNAPILSDAQKDSGYLATVDNPGAYYPGATVYYSTDDATFQEATAFNDKAIIGTCTTTLGSVTSPDVMDYGNTLTITLSNPDDSLTSVTEAELFNGANLAWVGAADGSRGELIQFQTATAESTPGTYTISNLLRGRRSTDHDTSSHVASEVFVLLSVWADLDYTETDVNKTRYYKFVTTGFDPDSVASVQFKNLGEGGKCRSVSNVVTFRDSGNDIDIAWLPRTRFFSSGIGYGPVDLRESEAYEIDITNNTFTTVYRTISTTSRTATYTAANATADGLTPSDTRYGVIYQVNAVRGRGHGKRFIC